MLNDCARLSDAMLESMETSVTKKAQHLLPVVEVIRDCGAGFLVIPQHAIGLDRDIAMLALLFIVVAGDDTDCALGPGQYDRAHLGRLTGKVDGFAAVYSAPPPEAYSGIALLAAADHNGLIIENRPEQEIASTNFVWADMPILLGSVKIPRE